VPLRTTRVFLSVALMNVLRCGLTVAGRYLQSSPDVNKRLTSDLLT